MDRIGPGDRPLTRPGGRSDRRKFGYRNHLRSRHHPKERHLHSQQSLWRRRRNRTRTLVSVTAVAEKAATWSLRAAPPPPVSGEETDEHIWKDYGLESSNSAGVTNLKVTATAKEGSRAWGGPTILHSRGRVDYWEGPVFFHRSSHSPFPGTPA